METRITTSSEEATADWLGDSVLVAEGADCGAFSWLLLDDVSELVPVLEDHQLSAKLSVSSVTAAEETIGSKRSVPVAIALWKKARRSSAFFEEDVDNEGRGLLSALATRP